MIRRHGPLLTCRALILLPGTFLFGGRGWISRGRVRLYDYGLRDRVQLRKFRLQERSAFLGYSILQRGRLIAITRVQFFSHIHPVDHLSERGEPHPVEKVVEGMDVAEKLYSGYGDQTTPLQ